MCRSRPEPGSGAGMAVLLLACLAASAAGASEPAARCQGRRSEDLVVGSVELRGLLDADSLRLLQLGMKGRLHIDAVVVRKRWGLFEQNAGTSASDAEIGFGAGRLVVDGRPQEGSEGSITLERVAVPLQERGRADQALTLRVSVRLRIVTASTLSKVAAWATESSEEDASSSIITRGLLSAVAEDLTRSAEATCPVASAR
jgi:hypothetical protein